MKRNKITINDGIVTIENHVRMTDFEIAELFGVFTQTIKANIKIILKSGVVTSDYSTVGTVVGTTVVPDFYGLDMVISLTFRVQSPQAELFREWVMRRLSSTQSKPLFLRMPNGAIFS